MNISVCIYLCLYSHKHVNILIDYIIYLVFDFMTLGVVVGKSEYFAIKIFIFIWNLLNKQI